MPANKFEEEMEISKLIQLLQEHQKNFPKATKVYAQSTDGFDNLQYYDFSYFDSSEKRVLLAADEKDERI